MNHIPTPETDSVRNKSGNVTQFADLLKFSKSQTLLCEDLERRLTIAREALKTISRMPIARLYPDGPCIERSDMNEALKALELTKSKS